MFKKIFFVLIFAVFILEGTLQAVSFLVNIKRTYLLRKQFSNTLNKDNSIICMGDSFTFGVGALDRGFPVQLEEIFHERVGNNIKVVNLGVPGANSAQIFRELKENFKNHNPAIVIILAGGNNECNLDGVLIYNWIERVDLFCSNSRTYRLARFLAIHFKENMNRKKFSSPAGKEHLSSEQTTIAEAVKKMEWLMEQDYRKGDYVREKEYALQILQMDPGSFTAHCHLLRMYSLEGDFEMARKEGLLALRYADDFTRSVETLRHLRMLAKDKTEFMEWVGPAFKKIAAMHDNPKKGEKYINIVIDDRQSFRIDMLKKDLERMIRYIRIRGALPILLTYPQGGNVFREEANNAIRLIAKRNNTTVVDLAEIFFEIKNGSLQEFKELVMADEHCSEQGYGVVAGELYEVITSSKIIKSLQR